MQEKILHQHLSMAKEDAGCTLYNPDWRQPMTLELAIGNPRAYDLSTKRGRKLAKRERRERTKKLAYIPPNKLFYTLQTESQSLRVIAAFQKMIDSFAEKGVNPGFRVHILADASDKLPALLPGEEYVVIYDTRYHSNQNYKLNTPPGRRTPEWGQRAASSVAVTHRMRPSSISNEHNPFEKCASQLVVSLGRRQQVERQKQRHAPNDADLRRAGIHGQRGDHGTFVRTPLISLEIRPVARALGQVRPPGA